MRRTAFALTIILFTSILFGVQFVELAESQSTFYDSFDSVTLGSDYEIVNSESVTFDLSANPGWLRISFTSPDDRVLSESVVNACMVLMQGFSGDFTVMTRVDAVMDQGEVSAGIVILKNNQSYLKFERLHSVSPVIHSLEGVPYYTGVRFEDSYGWDSYASGPGKDPTFLKIVREDDVFTAYYDYTGFPLIFDMDGPVDVGLYITSVGYNGTFYADFDYLIIQEKSNPSLTPTPEPTPESTPTSTPEPPLSVDPNFSLYTGLALLTIVIAVFAVFLLVRKHKH
jgi:hypothetical protein